MSLNNLPTDDNLLYFFFHPFTLVTIVLFVIFLLVKKHLQRPNAHQVKPMFITVLCTSLIGGLQTTTAIADKTTPLLETNNLKRKTLNLPTLAPSSTSALAPPNSIKKKSRSTKKTNLDSKLKAAIDPARTPAPAAIKPKKGSVNIKVKVGNITNTNGTIKIGTIEPNKK